MKYLGTNLLKSVQHHVHRLEDSYVLGFQFSPNVFIDSVQSQSKSQQTFFVEIDKFDSQIHREVQSRIAETVLKKITKLGNLPYLIARLLI